MSGLTAGGLWLLGLGQRRWTALNRIRFVLNAGLDNMNSGLLFQNVEFDELSLMCSTYFTSSFEKYSNDLLEVHRDTQRHVEILLASTHNLPFKQSGKSKSKLNEPTVTTGELILASSAILAILYSNRTPQNINLLLPLVLKGLKSETSSVAKANHSELMRYFVS